MTEGQVAFDEDQIALPPMFVKVLADFRNDQKTLLKLGELPNKDAERLRQHIALRLYPRVMSMMKIFAAAVADTYGLAANTAQRLDRFKNHVDDVFDEELGIEPTDGRIHGIDPATVDQLQRTLFTLGGILGEKLPGDAAAQEVFNQCVLLVQQIAEQNMAEPPPKRKGKKPAAASAEGDKEDDEEGDDGEGDDEEDGPEEGDDEGDE